MIGRECAEHSCPLSLQSGKVTTWEAGPSTSFFSHSHTSHTSHQSVARASFPPKTPSPPTVCWCCPTLPLIACRGNGLAAYAYCDHLRLKHKHHCVLDRWCEREGRRGVGPTLTLLGCPNLRPTSTPSPPGFPLPGTPNLALMRLLPPLRFTSSSRDPKPSPRPTPSRCTPPGAQAFNESSLETVPRSEVAYHYGHPLYQYALLQVGGQGGWA